MALRITGGLLRGRQVPEAVGVGIRPTSARVREALFDLVGHDLSGQRVLDAFGGSGLVAFEAWSRGAAVVVVERAPAAARGIQRRAASLGVEADVRVADVVRVAPSLGRFDGVFVDPPYADDPRTALAVLAPLVGRWLVLELPANAAAPEVTGLTVDRVRRYGGTTLVVYVPAAP